MQVQNSRALVSISRASKFTLPLVLMLAGLPKAFAADFIYCTLPDYTNHVIYFSELFQGDFGKKFEMEDAFKQRVKADYGNFVGEAGCSVTLTPDPHLSRTKLDSERASARNNFKKIVDTRWAY